ncbi:MAG: phosphohydrolase [Clostridiaceae bacterium]|nr:phosphohydrolase [Clostridiaceae bacterium]
MKFVTTDALKTGMRLAKPIYNKNGVMLYERNSKLTSQGIVSVHNFGLIGVYILEPAEPVPPMTEDDIAFERFQAMSIFTIREILDALSKQQETSELYPFANQVIKNYGMLHHKINFVQNLRSSEDYTYKHALNTAILCALMTKRLEMDFKTQLDIVVAGILYDIGSLLIPMALRKKKTDDLTEEEVTKINTYHMAGYQILNKDYDMDPSVKRIATHALRSLYPLNDGGDTAPAAEDLGAEVLRVAVVFDKMTAMKYGEEPLSEIMALRHLLDEKNGYDQTVVQALIDSINILTPGVCVELSNGDKGLVIAEGAVNVLEPFVLSFRDNQIYNMADSQVAGEIQIVDIMKTMDNRHVIDREMLEKYTGNTVYMGETRTKKHY